MSAHLPVSPGFRRSLGIAFFAILFGLAAGWLAIQSTLTPSGATDARPHELPAAAADRIIGLNEARQAVAQDAGFSEANWSPGGNGDLRQAWPCPTPSEATVAKLLCSALAPTWYSSEFSRHDLTTSWFPRVKSQVGHFVTTSLKALHPSEFSFEKEQFTVTVAVPGAVPLRCPAADEKHLSRCPGIDPRYGCLLITPVPESEHFIEREARFRWLASDWDATTRDGDRLMPFTEAVLTVTVPAGSAEDFKQRLTRLRTEVLWEPVAIRESRLSERNGGERYIFLEAAIKAFRLVDQDGFVVFDCSWESIRRRLQIDEPSRQPDFDIKSPPAVPSGLASQPITRRSGAPPVPRVDPAAADYDAKCIRVRSLIAEATKRMGECSDSGFYYGVHQEECRHDKLEALSKLEALLRASRCNHARRH